MICYPGGSLFHGEIAGQRLVEAGDADRAKPHKRADQQGPQQPAITRPAESGEQ